MKELTDKEKEAIEFLKKLPVILEIKHLGGAEEIETILALIAQQQNEDNRTA